MRPERWLHAGFNVPSSLIKVAAWLCSLLLLAVSPGALSAPSPRIFVYDLPPDLQRLAFTAPWYGDGLLKQVKKSPYYEPDPNKADYFWIPAGGRYVDRGVPLKLVQYVRTALPYWNKTVAAGQARHILVTTLDGGPGEAFAVAMNNGEVTPDFSPASPSRNIIYLSFNGMRDGADIGDKRCYVCFQLGKDIMIPSPQGVCGPLCGYTIQTLRQKSIWAKTPDAVQAAINQKRKHIMFFGGHIGTPSNDDYTGRGNAYAHLGNRSGYHIARSGAGPRISFPDAMLESEFCYSPLGGNGGDTDRYVPGMLFGCIPVLLNTSHRGRRVPQALPLEEVINWQDFGTVADVDNMADLARQLECLAPRLVQMRAQLRRAWPWFLYTSIHGSYLNETGSEDAFAMLMRVLASRVPQGYKPAAETMARMAHPASLFPCRPEGPASQHQHTPAGLRA